MTLHEDFAPYRKGLPITPNYKDIAWAYLKAMYDKEDEVGIFCLFELGDTDSRQRKRVINLLSELKLAESTNPERDLFNQWMRIKPTGENAIESFKSLTEYEQHLEEKKRTKQQNASIHIGGSVFDSQLGQGSFFGDLVSSNNRTSTTTNPKVADPKNEDQNTSTLNIWQRVYKWTNHNLISVIITGILGFLATALLKWLGWL